MNEATQLAPAERLLTLPEVLGRCRFGRTTLYDLKRRGEFPDPVKVVRTPLWKEREVDDWIRNLSADRNPPLTNPPPPGNRSRRGRRKSQH